MHCSLVVLSQDPQRKTCLVRNSPGGHSQLSDLHSITFNSFKYFCDRTPVCILLGNRPPGPCPIPYHFSISLHIKLLRLANSTVNYHHEGLNGDAVVLGCLIDKPTCVLQLELTPPLPFGRLVRRIAEESGGGERSGSRPQSPEGTAACVDAFV